MSTQGKPRKTRRATRADRRGEPGVGWERRLARQGFRLVAGLDEVGRGCWAGPLLAGAVVLPPPTPGLRRVLLGLRDSKQLTYLQRDRLNDVIRDAAVAYGIGEVEAPAIDLLGLTAAGKLALERAARALPVTPDYLLIDAFTLPGYVGCQEGIIAGDALCLSIAAASVIAKVERDRKLEELGRRYPGYGFERHRGYGTEEHGLALARIGPTPEHRRSWAPVRAILEACSAHSLPGSLASEASSLPNSI